MLPRIEEWADEPDEYRNPLQPPRRHIGCQVKPTHDEASIMKAARLYGPNDIRIMDVETPKPGPHDLLCRVVRAGICGTDYSIYAGEFSGVKDGSVKFPMTPGHEWSGVVEGPGSAAAGFKAGDRVVGDTGISCGACYECLVGQYSRCSKGRSVGTVNAVDGAWAEYILMPARHVFHIPDSVSFDNGALVEPAATALFTVTQAGVGPGDAVLVLGSGAIGIAAAKLAKLSGAARVVVVGRKPFKLRVALRLGADGVINTTETSLQEGVIDRFGGWEVDRVVEASGSIDLLKAALDIVRVGGSVATVAFYDGKMDGLDIDRVVLRGITIKGVSGSLGMYRPILRLMDSDMLDLTPLITARLSLGDIPAALSQRKQTGRRIKSMVNVSPQP